MFFFLFCGCYFLYFCVRIEMTNKNISDIHFNQKIIYDEDDFLCNRKATP